MHTELRINTREDGILINPWPAVILGLANALVAAFCLWALGIATMPLVFLGMLAAGSAVAIRPASPLVLHFAAVAGLFCALGTPRSWDTAQLLISLMTVVAFVAAVLMLLPRVIRRTAVSLLILVHFGGILTAVTTVPPQPMLSMFVWTYVYRPYLEFMHLNNAYHFYSPEPGPGTLVWFYVKYEDGSARWFKIPNRADNPVTLEYQRRLSLVEGVNQMALNVTPSDELGQMRMRAGLQDKVPPHPEMSAAMQYRPPNQFSRIMLKTYARYAAKSVKHDTNPECKVTGVRIYRIIHKLMRPIDVMEHEDPEEPWTYYPFYQGEFTAEGNLKDPDSPYLDWMIPIYKSYRAVKASEIGTSQSAGVDFDVVNCLDRHIELAVPKEVERVPDFVPGQALRQPRS